jgi:hypothetical protein
VWPVKNNVARQKVIRSLNIFMISYGSVIKTECRTKGRY